MFIEIKRNILEEEMSANIDLVTKEEILRMYQNKIIEYIKILKEVFESDFDKLNNKELYQMLSKIYNIKFEEEDYLKILSKKNNKKYIFTIGIPTRMTYEEETIENNDKLYQIYYLVAISDDFKFDYNKIYSKKEIKKLVANKKIVILKEEKEEITNSDDFKTETYETIGELNALNNSDLFGKILRQNITNKKVLNDMKELILETNDDIEQIFSCTEESKIYKRN